MRMSRQRARAGKKWRKAKPRFGEIDRYFISPRLF